VGYIFHRTQGLVEWKVLRYEDIPQIYEFCIAMRNGGMGFRKRYLFPGTGISAMDDHWFAFIVSK
jgi:hypothetical protein